MTNVLSDFTVFVFVYNKFKNSTNTKYKMEKTFTHINQKQFKTYKIYIYKWVKKIVFFCWMTSPHIKPAKKNKHLEKRKICTKVLNKTKDES